MIPFEQIKEEGTWTLFMDRDDTINKRIPGDYVKSWSQFEFLPYALEAITYFSQIFNKLIIVTNQQGIGKELMTSEDLDKIHSRMIDEIISAGGFIDQIYYCPHLAIEDPMCRKPNPGMAFQAAEDFPDIDFKKSVMVGDAISDMGFGYNLGMKNVLVNRRTQQISIDQSEMVDLELASLHELAIYLKNY